MKTAIKVTAIANHTGIIPDGEGNEYDTLTIFSANGCTVSVATVQIAVLQPNQWLTLSITSEAADVAIGSGTANVFLFESVGVGQ